MRWAEITKIFLCWTECLQSLVSVCSSLWDNDFKNKNVTSAHQARSRGKHWSCWSLFLISTTFHSVQHGVTSTSSVPSLKLPHQIKYLVDGCSKNSSRDFIFIRWISSGNETHYLRVALYCENKLTQWELSWWWDSFKCTSCITWSISTISKGYIREYFLNTTERPCNLSKSLRKGLSKMETVPLQQVAGVTLYIQEEKGGYIVWMRGWV